MSHPGSFIEGPDQMDVVVDGLQNINAEDEFKTSEHDENEYQADAEAGKSQDLKGTPSSLNPLTEKVMLQNDLGDNVLSEYRRDPQEEFFKLAILSLKMIHTEKEEAEYIYEVNSTKLFE